MPAIVRRAMLGGALVVSSMAMSACGGNEAPPPEEQAAETMAEAVQQMQQAAEKMSTASSDQPLIPGATLLEHLPASIDGMDRSNAERNETGAMGFKVSTASASYRGEDRSIDVSLTDVGGTGMMAAMGAAWSMVDVDKANDEGYERTVTIDGNRGYETEKLRNGRQETELSVIVRQRVLVKLEGKNVSMDKLRDALKALRVQELVGAS